MMTSRISWTSSVPMSSSTAPTTAISISAAILDGMHVISEQLGLDPDLARRIVDVNGRSALNIDPSFTPAPPPTVFDIPDDVIALGGAQFAAP